ncbi:MAG: bifunctional phosphoribosyl-AMP cyclohydrolase/phosphoribosyl-ATP diphosphatase HisIE [Thermodesulfobacteriota bacterium]
MINTDEIKFSSHGLIPAIAQDAVSGEVLMLAYMNKESLDKTLSTGKAHYFSRSRDKLWLKGETSGNFQEITEVLYDCDADTILLKVRQTGSACHTGERSCFFRRLDTGGKETKDASVIAELFRVIEKRKKANVEESYVASLFSNGLPKIAAKIHEEAAELISSAKNGGKEEITHELCDLWFHTLVLLGHKGIDIEDVFKELSRRSGTSGLEEKASRKKD